MTLCYNILYSADVALMAEQSLRKGEVRGSTPLIGSIDVNFFVILSFKESMNKNMYSRRISIEEARNKKKTIIFILLTVILIVLVVTLGLPSAAKFASFLTELRSTTEPVESTDTTPPPPPQLEPLPSFTNQLRVEIKGSTEPGASVMLSLNNQSEELLADNDGKFSFTFPLNDGENTVSALSKDNSGNESSETQVQKIIYDDEPPLLEISKPQDKAEFFGSKQRQTVIEGKSENGAKVQINERLVVVEEDGSFTFATTLVEGENHFTIIAQDPAGNKTQLSLTLSFTL